MSVSTGCAAILAAAGLQPLSVSANNVSGSGQGFSLCGTVNGSGTATSVSGGSGSYAYSWSQVGTAASGGPFSIFSATSKDPTWSDTRCDTPGTNSENWKLDVTDTTTGQTASTTISVTLFWVNLN